MIPRYKIEIINSKDYTSKWGIVDLDLFADAGEDMLNEYASKGYHLSAQSSHADAYGRTLLILTFEYPAEAI